MAVWAGGERTKILLKDAFHSWFAGAAFSKRETRAVVTRNVIIFRAFFSAWKRRAAYQSLLAIKHTFYTERRKNYSGKRNFARWSKL